MRLTALWTSRRVSILSMWPTHLSLRARILQRMSIVLVYLLASSRTDFPVMWETIRLLAPFSIAQACSSSFQASQPYVSFEQTPVQYIRSFKRSDTVFEDQILLIFPAAVHAITMRA